MPLDDEVTLMQIAREIFTNEELEEILLFEESNEIDLDMSEVLGDD